MLVICCNSVAPVTHLVYCVFEMLQIWTDGSCLRNGRRNATSGVGIVQSEHGIRGLSTAVPGVRQTNNRAELYAVMYALCLVPGSSSVIIYTDSKYSIDCITIHSTKWKANGWRTTKGSSVEWTEIICYILLLIESRLEKGGSTSFVHVKGHSTDRNNNRADQLAREAASRGTVPAIIHFIHCRCKVPWC